MTIRNQENLIAVSHADPTLADKAGALAAQLGLPIYKPKENAPALLLTLTPDRLELRQTDKGAGGPVWVDFVQGAVDYRRRHGNSRREAIARAAGIKGAKPPSVLDVTAGLGRDGFILASLGCKVQLVERSPVVAALLEDGLRRAGEADGAAGIIRQRLNLIVGNGLKILNTWQGEKPEVVYIDPMYPHRGKSALVKKEMRLIRLLVGDDEDSDALLRAALAVASRRVVVKRPRLAPALIGPEPNFTISGKNSRFDVYLVLSPNPR